MSNVAIYYKMTDSQHSDDVILEIKEVIRNIDRTVIGVHIDTYNQSDKFSNLVNQDLSSLDTLYLNKELEDDFDNQLISEIARSLQFKIIYFDEI